MTIQYPLHLHQSPRHDFDYCFLFQNCGDIPVLKRIYDFHAGIFPSFNSFKHVFSQIVNVPGECMVISNKSSDRSFNEKVSWYAADHPNKLSVICPTKDPFIVSINDMTKQLKNDLDGIVYATKLTIDEILTDMTVKVNSIKIQFEKDKNILLRKYGENKNIDTDEKYIGSLFREQKKDDIGSKSVDIYEYNENESDYDDDIEDDDGKDDDNEHVVLFKTSSFDFEEIFKCDKRPTNNGHSNIKKNIDEMQI